MSVQVGSRGILIHGMLLVLVGLVWGFAVPATPHPRLALGAHIQFVTNGILFMVVATALLTLPHSVGLKSIRVAVWLTWAMAMSEVANSWWGTMQTLPLAGRQAGAAGGKPWQELVVTVTHLAAGLALIIALALRIEFQRTSGGTLRLQCPRGRARMNCSPAAISPITRHQARPMNLAALLLCVFSTFAMTGLIWLIQVVQYPLMSEVGEGSFVTYEQAHCQRITPVVLPLMTAELFSAAWLLWRPVQGCSVVLTIAFAALLVVWASTFFIQVPVHNQLCVAFNAEQHRWLVQSNWIRTAMWSVRSGLMIWVLAQQLLLRAGAR